MKFKLLSVINILIPEYLDEFEQVCGKLLDNTLITGARMKYYFRIITFIIR